MNIPPGAQAIENITFAIEPHLSEAMRAYMAAHLEAIVYVNEERRLALRTRFDELWIFSWDVCYPFHPDDREFTVEVKAEEGAPEQPERPAFAFYAQLRLRMQKGPSLVTVQPFTRIQVHDFGAPDIEERLPEEKPTKERIQ